MLPHGVVLMTSTPKLYSNPFYIYPRKPRSKSGKPIYYVQFKCENSKSTTTTAKSTGTSNYGEAMQIAWKWYSSGNIPDRINAKKANDKSFQLQTVLHAIRDGNLTTNDLEKIVESLQKNYNVSAGVIPNTASARTVEDYLTEFWDKTRSPYLRERKMSSKTMSTNQLQMMARSVKNFWIPKFGSREIGSLTKKEIQEWLWEIKETQYNVGQKTINKQYLSFGYVNKIISAGVQALKYAYENKEIETDCFTGIVYLTPNPKSRKILTIEQAKKVFELEWDHPNAKLGNQVAMLTGLRVGEILALRPIDLGENEIYVRHSYSFQDGLKCPKNGKERIVPASKELIAALKKQAKTNPYKLGDKGFIFWSTTDPTKPFEKKVWTTQLKKQLKKIGVKEYKEIVFHSWRHFFTTYTEPHLQHSDLQKVTGHQSEKMLSHYANHQTSIAIQNVGKAVCEHLLPLASL